MTVAVRRYQQKSMVAAAAMSNLLGSLISLPFAQGITSVTAHDIGMLRDVRRPAGRDWA